MLYADDRGLSRVYGMRFDDGHWQMWRHTPAFSHRFHARLDAAAGVVRGYWEKSTDEGITREHDFNVDYVPESASELSH